MYRIIPLGLFTAVYSYLGKHTAMEKIKLQTTQNMDEFHRHHSELKKPDTKRKKKKKHCMTPFIWILKTRKTNLWH